MELEDKFDTDSLPSMYISAALEDNSVKKPAGFVPKAPLLTQPNYPRRWKATLYVVGFILLEILAITRTCLLVGTLTTYRLDWSRCEPDKPEQNQTESEALFDLGPDFGWKDLLYIAHSILHWPEYACLAYGTWNLLQQMRLWSESSKRKIKEMMKKNFCRRRMAVSVIAVAFFVVISIAIPILGVADAYEQSQRYPDCDKNDVHLLIHYIYQGLSVFAHCFSLGARVFMAVMVLAVQAMWFYDKTGDIEQRPTILNDADASEDWKYASSRHYQCTVEYELRQGKIQVVLGVFRAWFVIQSFIYYLQFIVDLTQALKPYLDGHPVLDFGHVHRIVYTVYDFLAFGIPHVSGVRINHYHHYYLRCLRRRLLNNAKNPRMKGTKVCFTIASTLNLEKSSSCDFVPNIPHTGISIPLDNPGYVLGIFLTFFTLLRGYVVV